MRTYTPQATPDAQHLLGVLIDDASQPEAYRDAMTALGRQLAVRIEPMIAGIKDAAICIVCTVEDADFLAKGLLETLAGAGVDASRLKLVCFWNERVRRFTGDDHDSFDIAPIIKQYREDFDLNDAVLVVVKSIISGSCVVKTNLAALIDHVVPQRIIVAAPVMLQGAEARLAEQFPLSTSERFEYLTFAIDDEKGEDDNVVPGIGGSVYERLGFADKTSYVPELVKQRRRGLAHA